MKLFYIVLEAVDSRAAEIVLCKQAGKNVHANEFMDRREEEYTIETLSRQ